MSDMFLGSQAPLYQNVRVRCINSKTGKCRVERTAKNRVTRLMLWGISKFLAGEFNDSSPDKIYEYLPRYVAVGKNVPGVDAASAGVTTMVTVNDTRLLNEITESSSAGETQSVKRVAIQGRQHMKTETRFSDPFVKLSLTMYLSSHQYDDVEIGEAGLFSKETGNNCLARVVFSPFQKGPDEVVEICWDITLLSYGETKYPNNITIDEPSRVIIPLYYSPYFIQSTHLKLYLVEETDSSKWLRLKVNDESMAMPLFSVGSDNRFYIESSYISVDSDGRYIPAPDSDLAEEMTAWSEYLQANDILFDNVIRQIVDYGTLSGDNIILDPDNSVCSMYFSEAERLLDNITLLADNEGALLQDSERAYLSVEGAASLSTAGKGLYVSRIFKQEISYSKEDTSYIISPEFDRIIETSSNFTAYTIHNNQIYRMEGDLEVETNGYLENGRIMNGTAPTEYVYDTETGVISRVEQISEPENQITSAFVVPSAGVYRIYTTTSYQNVTQYTNYWIDWHNDKLVHHQTQGSTEYHITNDLFFASGDTHKMPYTITPTDATDRTVSWSSLNDNIAMVNQFGIVSGWNIGETYITVTTSNGIKARIVVEVVKNLEIVKTTGIELTPNVITMQASSTDPQTTIVTAVVQPASATYNVVTWSMDAEAQALFSFASQRNNKVKVWSNATGNVGRGYIIATTADGVSARCLIQLLSDNEESGEDCPHPEHDVPAITS